MCQLRQLLVVGRRKNTNLTNIIAKSRNLIDPDVSREKRLQFLVSVDERVRRHQRHERRC